MDLLRDLWFFVVALWSYWYWLVGGIVIAAADLYERIFKRKKISIGWRSTAIICLVVAMFLTWRDEYWELQLFKSRFTASMTTATSFFNLGQEIFVAALIQLRNSGPPSIADNFELTLILNDGRRVKARIVNTSQDIKLPDGTFIAKTDTIYDKAISQPIGTGAALPGIVLGEITGATKEELSQSGTRLLVEFSDVNGTRYSVESKGKFSTDKRRLLTTPGLKSILKP